MRSLHRPRLLSFASPVSAQRKLGALKRGRAELLAARCMCPRRCSLVDNFLGNLLGVSRILPLPLRSPLQLIELDTFLAHALAARRIRPA
eukprot:scaffold5362_cov100-Isochrysis_galbana.AAC.4